MKTNNFLKNHKKEKRIKFIIEKHKHEGIYILRGKEDALCTLNMVPGESVYGEKRFSVLCEKKNTKIEYRIWNPFRSKLAAAILGGIDNTYIKPGIKILYIGAANGTTVSHISDIIRHQGTIYAVEFSHRSGRDLINTARKRLNIIPIIEDARYPHKYRMFLNAVDLIFCDVSQPDQERILTINAKYFLKSNGHFITVIKANCIDSTVDAALVFAKEVQKLQKADFYPIEQITLEPYERDHAVVLGKYNA